MDRHRPTDTAFPLCVYFIHFVHIKPNFISSTATALRHRSTVTVSSIRGRSSIPERGVETFLFTTTVTTSAQGRGLQGPGGTDNVCIRACTNDSNQTLYRTFRAFSGHSLLQRKGYS
jgi:hypothetical protein